MAIFKFNFFVPIILIVMIILSCNADKKNTPFQANNEFTVIDSINIGSELKQSSLAFVEKHNYSNRLIEVDIDKKEPNEIIISFACRGIADFEIKKYSPSFSYKIGNNLFFIYSGVEELLLGKFDSTRYTNYNFDICNDPKKGTYIFEDNKMREDTIGLHPFPFSNIPPPSPPPGK